MTINNKILEEYYKDGLLHKQTHPALPLNVWNYTPKVQYERLWDEITLSCRGLVTDDNGNIVARCLSKFFNMEELSPDNIPNESFVVTEKMDGSYISVFNYDELWIVASRGSFISDQAIKAKELLLTKYNYGFKYGLNPDFTYIMEVIYPENRIVVNYGDDEKLVIITAINNKTGGEVAIEDMVDYGFEIVKKYDGVFHFNQLKQKIGDNEEGFVVRFKSGFRMKIKGEEYVRLHKILTNVSNRIIWEYLKDNKSLDELLERVPDEFYNWVKETERSLIESFIHIKESSEGIFSLLTSNSLARKDFALQVLKLPISYHSILFAMYDNKSIDEIIWKQLYPKSQKPFIKDC